MAAAGALYGGSLIGRWCVGLLLIAGSLAVAADALLRDTDVPASPGRAGIHEDVLDRWRRAR